MSSIVPNENFLIDDVFLLKNEAAGKMRHVIDTVDKNNNAAMIRTASSGSSGSEDTKTLITLFTAMLSALNMSSKSTDLGGLIAKIAEGSDSLVKQSSMEKTGREKRDDIKIVSKSIKDSHYQVDVSKDVVKQNGKEVFMVSCYAKDSYLGRYLIKRNYFYTVDREKFADSAYDEIMTKIGALKDRYYNEVIDISGVFGQIKQVLDGVISEIKMEEDSIGNLRR
jgi:hypothetical protein